MHGHEPQISDIFIFWFNFLVFIVGFFLLTRKVIAGAWDNRRLRLINALEGAQNELASAELYLAEVERKFSTLETKIDMINLVFSNEAKKESLEIVESAKKTASTVVNKAKASVSAELRIGLKNLQRSTLDSAFQKASSLMKLSADSELDSKLVNKTISDSAKFKFLH